MHKIFSLFGIAHRNGKSGSGKFSARPYCDPGKLSGMFERHVRAALCTAVVSGWSRDSGYTFWYSGYPFYGVLDGLVTNWGILGCGNIANKFAECVLKAVKGAQLAGAAARDKDRAERFASKYGIPKAYGAYEQLARDPDIDAVYIATPHSHHRDHAVLCLEHGKAVLCEKPLTVNARQAAEIASLAREKNLFLMEAMWMRFLPAILQLRKLLDDGRLGEVRSVSADFSFAGPANPDGRLLNPALAGGALLDVGVYPLSFALMVFQDQPTRVHGAPEFGVTGVDVSNSVTLEFSGGRTAILTSSVAGHGSQLARIECQKGVIEIPRFWKGEEIKISMDSSKEDIHMPFECNGFEYEVREAVHCITSGRLESEIMPLSESLKTMALMDGLRDSWNLRYPMEN